MKNSTSYCQRQSFAGMIESILCDFCTLHEDPASNEIDLIALVINKYFL